MKTTKKIDDYINEGKLGNIAKDLYKSMNLNPEFKKLPEDVKRGALDDAMKAIKKRMGKLIK